MQPDYIELITHAVEGLPREEQAEVYDFVAFLKAKKTKTDGISKKTSSVFDLAGTGVNCKETDISINHDRYLYE